ncbi:MAG TPA: M28 family peptidase [Acidobacteriota bacterium]|nr:M28 family peptidase [Acidobacteriota bacterium]
MKKRFLLLPLLPLGLLLFLPISLTAPHDVVESQTASSTITAADLRSRVHFLAAEEMQGRDTGSLTNRITANYLAHQLEMMGLRPAGDDGSFFQQVHLVQSRLEDGNRMEILSSDSTFLRGAVLGEDFYPSPLSGTRAIEAPVVFAGYGITAPEYRYDDYASLDVAGKAVLVMDGEPHGNSADGPFMGLAATEYSQAYHKINNAQKRGAAAVIFLNPNRRGDLSRARNFAWPEEISDARYYLDHWVRAISIPAVVASPALVEDLFVSEMPDFREMRREIDQGERIEYARLALRSIRIETAIHRETVQAPNVLALLEGSHPTRKDELVVIGAHFDHLGVAADGRIYRGADDDSSGTAGVLEVAGAFSSLPAPPSRSVLFALWNAEEQGLLGSRFYVDHPKIPLDETVAVFQLDMIGRNQEVPSSDHPRYGGLPEQSPEENDNMVHLIGYSANQELTRVVRDGNLSIGLELRKELDNHRLNLLRRSDNWPFFVAGVPSLFFTTGLHPEYHTPEDVPEKLQFEKMERIVRLVFLSALEVAEAEDRPAMSRP